MLDRTRWRQSASADFLFGKTPSSQGEVTYGMIIVKDLPDEFAFKAHGSFGAAPDNAEGDTPFPISFVRLRYLPVPTGYRKRSAQALERRAMQKVQRRQATQMDLAHGEAAGAARTSYSTCAP
eukprot:1584674-Amphidinium_carterae.1